ncbi:DUF4184 family protein [Actinoplanes sp. L3-i22]|uniref:DUF4184 family protein n=1 Tax=Actinoplanes sp. L3-i22 TaxID=2836373 RepID=UPI001C791EB8|nr:DUF4184 family protein [Actinoplanes sp. L3-i22]BCY08973.1 hypothetical protein L3i22_040610 [Actinoplanes sp. L3-i22]
MPFTGSHPAAILPFVRREGTVPSALVIGSVVPDLPYYLPIPVSAGATHSLIGTLTVDVMLGGVLFLLWHLLLAPFSVAVAPAPVRARIDLAHTSRTGPVTARGVTQVGLSLAVGAATHAIWDAFTHADGWGTKHIDWLGVQPTGGLPGYRWAQYVSGVIGAVVIGVWLLRWWRVTPRVARPGAGRVVAGTTWALMAATSVCGALARALPGAEPQVSTRTVFLAGTGAAGAGLAAAVLCAGWFVVRRRRAQCLRPLDGSARP